MRVTWISCFLTSVIFKYFYDCTVFSMETLMIGVLFIRNIDPNPISNLKPSHWSNFSAALPCQLRLRTIAVALTTSHFTRQRRQTYSSISSVSWKRMN